MNNNYALELKMDRLISILEQINTRLALIESNVKIINENQINKHVFEMRKLNKDKFNETG